MITNEDDIQRKYTFLVDIKSNKIEIRKAFEDIYNSGKKGDDKVKVVSVRTSILLGKKGRRMGAGRPGNKPNRKKAVITLAKGQTLEDYGV